MTAIVCEMCGSSDLIKNDGVYVCQNCGTKYSPEEAKKLIVEGVVEIQGTVSIDTTKQINNYISMLELAAKSRDIKDTEKYSEKIIELDPTRYEPYLYMAKSIEFESSPDQSALKKALSYAKKAALFAPPELQQDIAKDVFFDLKKQVLARFKTAFILEQNRPQDYDQIMHYWISIIVEIPNLPDGIIIDEYNHIHEISVSDSTEGTGLPDFESSTLHLAQSLKNESFYSRTLYDALPDRIKTQLGPYDNKSKDFEKVKSPKGCYVATAVYGSYDCPQVWTLRRYRDYTLAETWYGRAFIHTYYAVSPTLVKWFGNTDWFKKLLRPKLDRMVKRLNAEGLENTPYADRDW